MHSDLVRMAQLFPPKNESEHIKKNVSATTEKDKIKYDNKIEITFIRNREKEK
jgi:hypothetical protein